MANILINSIESNNSALALSTIKPSISALLSHVTVISLTDASYTEIISATAENETSNATIYIPYEKRLETYIIPIIFSIIFLLGLFGNGILVYAYFNQKCLRTIPNTYIISLSFGDMLTICGALPFVSTIYTVDSWPYGMFVCKFSELMRDLSTGISVYTLSILSFDRYVAIVCPLQRYASASRRRKITLMNTLCIWTGSLVIALPGFLNSHLKWIQVSKVKQIAVCYPFPQQFGDNYAKFIVLSKFLALYFIPLLFITIFYLAMARHLLRSSKHLKNCNLTDAHVKHMRSRAKVAKIVLIFIVLFAICFLPSHFFLLWFYFYPNAYQLYNDFWHYLRIVGFVLSFTNSCLNPIALYFISGVFRKQFQHYLYSCWCCERLLDKLCGCCGPKGKAKTGSGVTTALDTATDLANSLTEPVNSGQSTLNCTLQTTFVSTKQTFIPSLAIAHLLHRQKTKNCSSKANVTDKDEDEGLDDDDNFTRSSSICLRSCVSPSLANKTTLTLTSVVK